VLRFVEADCESQLQRGFSTPNVKLVYRGQILWFQVVDVLARARQGRKNLVAQVGSRIVLTDVLVQPAQFTVTLMVLIAASATGSSGLI
jgi:hypothetical protein